MYVFKFMVILTTICILIENCSLYESESKSRLFVRVQLFATLWAV